MEEFAVGQVVNFTFETKTRSGGRTNNYATGEIVKVSIKEACQSQGSSI